MNLIIAIYSYFINLYPDSFRKQFGDELKDVFSSLVAEAFSKGTWHVFKCIGREFYFLPGSILRAYMDSLGEIHMFPTRKVVKINTLGFSFTFALLALLNFFTRIGLQSVPSIPNTIIYTGWIIFAGIIMGFCGYIVAISLSAQRKDLIVLSFGVGYALSLIMTGPSIWSAFGISTEWVKGTIESVFVLGSSLVSGCVVGFIFGLVRQGWKAGFWYAIAGGIIFELGYVMNWITLFGINTFLMSRISFSFFSDPRWIAVIWVSAYLVFGAVVGSLWGLLIGRNREEGPTQEIERD